jgi:uncharacterized repeat protein (TIGR03803 family)
MKHQSRFSTGGLVTAALVAAVMFTGAALAAAQTELERIPSASSAVRFKTLVTFSGTNGADPNLAPIQGTDGNLYGGTAGGGKYGQGVLFKMTPSGTVTTRYNFCAESGCPDGKGGEPEVLGSDGNFYGETGGAGLLAMAPSSSSRKQAP